MFTVTAPIPRVTRVNWSVYPHTDPDPESGDIPGALYSWGWGVRGADPVDEVRDEVQVYGTDTPDERAGYIRATITTPGTAGLTGPHHQAGGLGVDQQVVAGAVGLAPGDSLTLSMYVRSSIAETYTPQARLTGWDEVNEEPLTGAVQFGDPVTLEPDTWARVSVTATVDIEYPNDYTLDILADVTARPAGTTVDSTMALVEAGAKLRSYFDGGSTPDGDESYHWTNYDSPTNGAYATAATTSASPDLVIDYTYTRTARTIVHEVVDQRSDPDVTLRPVSLRAGVLNLWCRTRELATELEDLHTASVPLELDASDDEPTASMTYVPTGLLTVTWDPTFNRWTVAAGYQEVSP